MADSQKDTIIKAQRFNTLKSQIKSECQRRKYKGSVEAFGGTSWDFVDIPATDKIIEQEQYRRLSIPIRKINWKNTPNGPYDRIINDIDLATMEAAYVAFRGRSLESRATTDCASSCTGTCTDTCSTGCYSGCSGGCTGCTGDCDGSCRGTCEGSCSGCGNACNTKCLGTCGNGCQGQCTTSCFLSGKEPGATECTDGCVSNCQMNCGDVCGPTCGKNCGATT